MKFSFDDVFNLNLRFFLRKIKSYVIQVVIDKLSIRSFKKINLKLCYIVTYIPAHDIVVMLPKNLKTPGILNFWQVILY